jgi:hypothetical protein
MRREMTTRKKMAAAAAFAATLWLGPQGVFAQDVAVDYDRQADFAKCATYAWAKGQPAQDPLVDQHIVQAIEQALAGKGWTKSDAAGCFVSYHASVNEQRSLQIWDGRGALRGGFGRVDVETIKNGTLVVDITDANGRLIWRGIARDTVSDKPEKNHKKLAKATEKLFKDLPGRGER